MYNFVQVCIKVWILWLKLNAYYILNKVFWNYLDWYLESKILGREHGQYIQQCKKCNVLLSIGTKERQTGLLKVFQNGGDAVLNRPNPKDVGVSLGDGHKV